MPEIALEHRLSAHCESGVTSSLLRHSGLDVSEPLAFGLGSGMFFVHVPLEKLLGPPSTSFRSLPGSLFRKACKRLGVQWESKTFRSRAAAGAELLSLIERGTPVGLQTSVYWLPYLPRRYRFQLNAHNILVYGRRDDSWLVSDPVLDVVVECPADALERARFAPGMLAPKGRLYYVSEAPPLTPDRLRRAIVQGAHETAHRMAHIPLPWFGGKGILTLASRVERWARSCKPQDAIVRLASVVRMQEEVGTGGAGFRYLQAAFLQEAGERLGEPVWAVWSERLTSIGDRWREFAARSARICRSKEVDPAAFHEVAELLRACGRDEMALFGEMAAALKPRASLATPALPPTSTPSLPPAR